MFFPYATSLTAYSDVGCESQISGWYAKSRTGVRSFASDTKAKEEHASPASKRALTLSAIGFDYCIPIVLTFMLPSSVPRGFDKRGCDFVCLVIRQECVGAGTCLALVVHSTSVVFCYRRV